MRSDQKKHVASDQPELMIGLEGVAVAKSAISYADGEKGELVYRGFWAGDLAKEKTFDEVLHLILYGKLPTSTELSRVQEALVARRALPDYMRQIVETAPKEASYMAVLRAALSVVPVEESSWPPTMEQLLDVFAKAPTILAHRYNYLNGKPINPPRADVRGHIENYLYMVQGEVPKPALARALSAYLILVMDHDINASTFAARVVTSTQADLVSALCAAIGALIGPLHGGAPSKVDDLLDEIGSEANADKVIRGKLERNERLIGFGHRVYKTWDPRAAALKYVVERLEEQDPLLRLSIAVEKAAVKLLDEYKPGRNLYPNVEFWAAAVMRAVGLPRELYTPTFCCSRIAGWGAHILEQAAGNRLIRPTAIYTGGMPDHPQDRS